MPTTSGGVGPHCVCVSVLFPSLLQGKHPTGVLDAPERRAGMKAVEIKGVGVGIPLRRKKIIFAFKDNSIFSETYFPFSNAVVSRTHRFLLEACLATFSLPGKKLN